MTSRTLSSSTTARPSPPPASAFRYFLPFQTRWLDNDQYGHLNNVVYSQYFDSITNHFLLTQLSPPPAAEKRPIGLIVASHTFYAAPLSYPQPVVAALAVKKLGTRSVEWSVALFAGEYAEVEEGGRAGEGGKLGEEGFTLSSLSAGGVGRRVRLVGGDKATAAAWGGMTHVFVDEETRKAVGGLDEEMRKGLEKLVVEETRAKL
ncbi:hypothetical protein JCM8097_001648 [Rhodosporidiobolus ruineniae]